MTSKSYWVYIILCQNNHLYTGYTDNLEKRYAKHVEGTASKYTRSFKPVLIAQSWEITAGKILAMKIERFIKKLSRMEKEKLIKNPHSLDLAAY